MKLLTEQIVSVGTALGVVCLFVLLVHLPQRYKLNDLADKVKDQEERLSRANLRTSALLPLDRRVDSLRQAVAEFDKRLLAPDCLKRVMVELELAKLTSDEIRDNIRPKSSTTMARHSESSASIEFRGGFLSICSFLDKIEKMTNLTRVKELKLETKRAGDPQIRATMVLNIYRNRS